MADRALAVSALWRRSEVTIRIPRVPKEGSDAGMRPLSFLDSPAGGSRAVHHNKLVLMIVKRRILMRKGDYKENKNEKGEGGTTPNNRMVEFRNSAEHLERLLGEQSFFGPVTLHNLSNRRLPPPPGTQMPRVPRLCQRALGSSDVMSVAVYSRTRPSPCPRPGSPISILSFFPPSFSMLANEWHGTNFRDGCVLGSTEPPFQEPSRRSSPMALSCH